MPNLLKTWISNFKRQTTAAILLGMALVALAWFGVYKIVDRNNRTYFGNVENTPIKTYSIGGEVVEVKGQTVVVKAGQIVTDKDGNKLVYNNFSVGVTKDTIFENKANTITVVGFSDLKPKTKVTVYTDQNPYENSKFTATKIDLN